MPLVAEDIKEYLNIDAKQALNPDYAVAEGAAIQAGIIEGIFNQEESIIITDVNPYTLGVKVTDGIVDNRMDVIIPRNVTIPTTRCQTYSTFMDYQTIASIEVYQGESMIVDSNHFLGDFLIQNIPPKRAGIEKIRVEFSYNLNGMLQVTASIPSTGADASIVINMMQDTDSHEDVSKWKSAPYAKQFRTVIRRAERLLKSLETEPFPTLEKNLEENLYLLKKAIIEEDIEAAKDAEEELLDILND